MLRTNPRLLNFESLVNVQNRFKKSVQKKSELRNINYLAKCRSSEPAKLNFRRRILDSIAENCTAACAKRFTQSGKLPGKLVFLALCRYFCPSLILTTVSPMTVLIATVIV